MSLPESWRPSPGPKSNTVYNLDFRGWKSASQKLEELGIEWNQYSDFYVDHGELFSTAYLKDGMEVACVNHCCRWLTVLATPRSWEKAIRRDQIKDRETKQFVPIPRRPSFAELCPQAEALTLNLELPTIQELIKHSPEMQAAHAAGVPLKLEHDAEGKMKLRTAWEIGLVKDEAGNIISVIHGGPNKQLPLTHVDMTKKAQCP